MKENHTIFMDAIKTFCDYILKKHSKSVVSVWVIKTPKEAVGELFLMVLVNDIRSPSAVRKIEKDAAKVEEAVFNNLDIRMHSGFYKLSRYFESVMKGDKDMFAEIRNSFPVYDPTGFFGPLKKLVESGKIVGTEESLMKLIYDVKERYSDIEKIKIHILENVYSAIVDSGQAAILSLGITYPSHKDIASQLEKHFVRKHKLEKRYASYCRDVIGFLKDVEHKKTKQVSGRQLDMIIRKGSMFLERMKELVEDNEKEGLNAG